MKSGTFVTNDRTCWIIITSGNGVGGRIAEHNVFKEKSGPTSYAKRNIGNGYAMSSWRLLIACYKPGPYITIDEQLFLSKARCRFTLYKPSKPDKLDIKFWLVTDVDSKYVLNGFPYLGKDKERLNSIT
ncbi:DDE_Tnp_1_7 domain-containing protein [Trichonephila clavata]|uniref:DDE_Tnp_1_7 domain-containing protein n=1 Tax=Trichonephila clavata TaxID=2740835 RepID=A0A8X6LXN6_TRICU|nr:DDE_Tnp_1_7 domain-containing protein [Trichonephila clavata]